jgi:methionine biosynthesis protein MetW
VSVDLEIPVKLDSTLAVPRAGERIDHRIITELVQPGSSVLDLGCGSGDLLDLLVREKGVTGRGVDVNNEDIFQCIARGLSVHHGDLDEGLEDYPDDSFDYVILSQTLQTVRKPLLVMREMLRVGCVGIISFPNYGHWQFRWQLLRRGRMPETDYLPYTWYETPNIHLLTVLDFHDFCRRHGFEILRGIYLSDNRFIHWRPNLRAKSALYMLRRAGGGLLPRPILDSAGRPLRSENEVDAGPLS